MTEKDGLPDNQQKKEEKAEEEEETEEMRFHNLLQECVQCPKMSIKPCLFRAPLLPNSTALGTRSQDTGALEAHARSTPQP